MTSFSRLFSLLSLPRLPLAMAGLFFLLAACRSQPSLLPPEDVMHRAAAAAQALQSARYHAEGNFRLEQTGFAEIEGTTVVDGVLASQGEQVHFTAEVNADLRIADAEPSALHGVLEVMVLGPAEVYMNVRNLTVDPPVDVLRPEVLAGVMGRWWLLPRDDAGAATDLSADPRMLRAQADVVRVAKDFGMGNINGRSVYRYAVTLDREKFVDYHRRLAQESGETFDEARTRASLEAMQAEGELWVDAQTFQVHYLSWTVASAELSENVLLSGTFRATLSDHDAIQPPVPPADAVPFDVLELWQAEPPALGGQGFPRDLEEEILQEVLKQAPGSAL